MADTGKKFNQQIETSYTQMIQRQLNGGMWYSQKNFNLLSEV